jgi:hypothetical protein
VNPKIKLFVALVLAGMFLVPPGTALASDGGSGGSAGESQSPSASSSPAKAPFFLTEPLELRSGSAATKEAAPKLAAANWLGEHPTTMLTLGDQKPTSGRGARAAPNVYPIGLRIVNPPAVDMWYGAGVISLKGAMTQFNITVNNSGDADANPVTETFIVNDYFGKLMYSDVQTQNIPAGTNYTFYFQFTPAYCSYYTINLTTHCAGNAYAQNEMIDINAVFLGYDQGGQPVYARIATALWADTGDSEAGWSGDIGASSIGQNKWHTTSNVASDLYPENHSAPSAWYHGRDVQQQYDNNQNISAKSPTIDFRNIGTYWNLMFDYTMHGALPAADIGDYLSNRVSTDNGATWSDEFAHLDGVQIAGSGPQTVAAFKNNWLIWVTAVSGGQITGIPITDLVAGKTGQFRNQFVSNAAVTDTGIYLDDLVIWGMEIMYDARVKMTTDLADMKVSEPKSITARVTNLRQAQPATFNCSLNVTKRGAPTNRIFTDVKVVNALGAGASLDIPFNAWTPLDKGDYVVVVNITGMKDENPGDNADYRWVHASGANPPILFVEDNPFAQPTGINTTDRLIAKVSAISGFDDYGVYYTLFKGGDVGRDFTGDGPTADIMKKYDVVVWCTGWDSRNQSINGTLTANDQTNLKSYLAAGGAVWMMSQGLINDIYPNTFTSGTLHVSSATNDTTIKGDNPTTPILPSPLQGVPGSLADGATYYVGQSSGLNSSWDEADRLKLDDSAQGVFFAGDPSDPTYVAIQISGTYRVVFQTFDFTWIQLPSDQDDYVQRVIAYLTGGLEMAVYGGGAPTSHLLVDPGGSVDYTMTIINGGTKARTLYDIDIQDIPSGWTATASPMVRNGDNPLDIAPQDSQDIVLTVTAPQKALAGVIADINISMTFSNYGRGLYNHTVTEVRAILGTEFVATTTEVNLTGPGTASYSFTLRNKGNLQITANLGKTGDRSEWITLGSPAVTLQPYEERLMSAVLTVPDGVFREAGNYTLRDNISSTVSYLGNISSANLSITTRIRINQIFSAKIDDFTLDPNDGQVDMSVAKPSAKLTVKITAQAANGYDNVTVELKPKSFTPASGSQRSWTDTTGWTLPKTTVATTPFMLAGKETGQLSILVPVKADAGDYVIEVRATPGSGRLSDGDTTTITIRVAKPDLVAVEGSISFNPKEPEVGTAVKIKVTVKNIGGVLAKDVDVSFYTSGENLIETKRITSLPATTGSASVEITWEGVALGENEIMVRVDPANAILELDEANNEITDIVVGYRSDLVIDAVPLFYKEGRIVTKVNDGDTVTIEVTVKNSGAYALNLTGIKVQVTDQKTGEVLPFQTVAISTRAELKVTFIWTVKKTGDHAFEVKVNPDGATGIKETSYDNNAQTATLKVVTPPTDGGGGLGGMTLYAIIGVVAIVAVVAVVAMMMRRKPKAAAPAPAPAVEAEVVEAETVEPAK